MEPVNYIVYNIIILLQNCDQDLYGSVDRVSFLHPRAQPIYGIPGVEGGELDTNANKLYKSRGFPGIQGTYDAFVVNGNNVHTMRQLVIIIITNSSDIYIFCVLFFYINGKKALLLFYLVVFKHGFVVW